MKKFLLLALLLLPLSCMAQVGALPNGRVQYSNSSGLLVGGLVYSCVGGSTCPGTPLATYTDYTGNTQNANPVVLDSNGSASIWLTPNTSYKFVIEDINGVVQWTMDGITVQGSSSAVNFAVKYLNGIRFADQFTGASATAKQDAAITDCGAGPCDIIDTTNLAAGNASSYPNAVPIIDLRQTYDFIINKASNADRVASLLIKNDLGDFTTRPLTGTFTMTNGSAAVTGVGTAFSSELGGGTGGSMLKLSADCSSCWAWVSSIADDTHLTLGATYTGAGGSGAAVSTVTAHPFVIHRVISTATSPSAGVGEAGGISVIESRTSGNRSVYGANVNLSYSTAASHTNGNVIGTEIDISNNSGSDDDTGTSTIGLDVLSAGTNHPDTGVQIVASDAANNGWRRGVFISGFTGGVGLQVQGPQDLAQWLPTADDTNPQVGGRLSDDSAYTWKVDNSGNATFKSSSVTTFTASQTLVGPVAENAPAISNATNTATASDSAQVATGFYGEAYIGASNTKNWTSTYALRGVIGQTKVTSGATGTITGAVGFLANPIVEAGTVTNQYGFYALVPTGAGTITNKYSYGADAGAGVANIPDGFATAGQFTSSVTTGTAPIVVSSTTPIANLNAHAIVYDHAGTQIVSPHTVQDQCTLGTSCSVGLSGSAQFANTSYICMARDVTTAANVVTIAKTSATQIDFTGTGTDVIEYSCTGR